MVANVSVYSYKSTSQRSFYPHTDAPSRNLIWKSRTSQRSSLEARSSNGLEGRSECDPYEDIFSSTGVSAGCFLFSYCSLLFGIQPQALGYLLEGNMKFESPLVGRLTSAIIKLYGGCLLLTKSMVQGSSLIQIQETKKIGGSDLGRGHGINESVELAIKNPLSFTSSLKQLGGIGPRNRS